MQGFWNTNLIILLSNNMILFSSILVMSFFLIPQNQRLSISFFFFFFLKIYNIFEFWARYSFLKNQNFLLRKVFSVEGHLKQWCTLSVLFIWKYLCFILFLKGYLATYKNLSRRLFSFYIWYSAGSRIGLFLLILPGTHCPSWYQWIGVFYHFQKIMRLFFPLIASPLPFLITPYRRHQLDSLIIAPVS